MQYLDVRLVLVFIFVLKSDNDIFLIIDNMVTSQYIKIIIVHIMPDMED